MLNLKPFLVATAVLLGSSIGFSGSAATPGESQAGEGAQNAEWYSKVLERKMQQLSWPQFRFVVESVPKLKADLDALGEVGWAYVKTRYTTFAWAPKIDRLDDQQKHLLADLLDVAKTKGGSD